METLKKILSHIKEDRGVACLRRDGRVHPVESVVKGGGSRE